MKGFILTALVSLTIGNIAQAKSCEGIFPKNNRWIGVGFLDDGISQDVFNGVLDKLVAIYNPIVQSNGYELVFNRLWDDGTVNSDTDTEGNQWVINSYGGLARYKGMTADGYAAVACHELGHHLGGAPQFSDGSNMSVEGEADYHVGKCLPKYFAADNNVQMMKSVQIDPMVISKCTAIYAGNAEATAICERVSLASFVVADILRDLEGDPAIAFNTPDPSVVQTVFEDHPAAQCRLDTYFNAAICPAVASNTPFDNNDYTVASCVSGDGARPACWFAPPQAH